MAKELIVSSTSLESRLAIIEDDQVTEIFIERSKNKGILGNIYKGRVTKVLPGMQAAFVDIGLERHAFLYVSDFLEDLEEYEELFTQTEESVDQLLRIEAEGEPGEIRRTRKTRRARREVTNGRREAKGTSEKESPSRAARSRDAQPRKTASPPSSQAGEALGASTRPMVPRSLIPTAVENILPDPVLFTGVEDRQGAASGRDEDRDQPAILPDRLNPMPAQVRFESREKGEDLQDAEARLDPPESLSRFATRSEARSRSRSQSPKGNGQAQIGDLLKEGQEILVQVAKEPIGKKGARITSHIALPGRFMVFMPTVDHIGVSRKIASPTERQRLREIVMGLRGDFAKGFIVRTAGENRSEKDLQADMVYLTRLWETIRERADKATAPTLIHAEPTLVQRVVRDYFSEEYRAVRVDDEQEYERIVDFVSHVNPELVNRIRLFNKNIPIFDEFGVTTEIEKALKHKVWLKNGGYIVINQTEALVAIDVNTGKFVGNTNSLEDTITRTNLDAVKEVVRQLRLRDLGGIIIIDFIDMDERRNRQKVMEALQNELTKDKAPSKILQFNEFGLVAITRKRVKQSLERTLCQPCVYCTGTGMTKSIRTICYEIHQEIRKVVRQLGDGQELLLRCHPDVCSALNNGEKEVLREIEEMTHKVVTIQPDPLVHLERFDIIET